jgi:uncharacterized membrane protein
MNWHVPNWHQAHAEGLTFGERVADRVVTTMGSWAFIICQSIILIAWIAYNLKGGAPFDPWPFILLNLALSFQAAYAAPFIMISQNRQATRDRAQADADYDTNVKAKEEIEALQQHLSRLEIEKLNEILQLLQTVRNEKA